jgi:acyl carrier protein|nr:acyl carrier protein [uncultured Acetatifactor sp.]
MEEKIMDEILEIVGQNIDNNDILTQQLDKDLAELGMDSISFIKIIVLLEEHFSCEIPDEKLTMDQLNTCNKLYDIVSTTLVLDK